MIGHLIPEDQPNWKHYLEILNILDIVCATVVHTNTPGCLQVLIESSLSTFRDLYPGNSVIPKMHYLLHLPQYIEK